VTDATFEAEVLKSEQPIIVDYWRSLAVRGENDVRAKLVSSLLIIGLDRPGRP
jgi:hypothetical protein